MHQCKEKTNEKDAQHKVHYHTPSLIRPILRLLVSSTLNQKLFTVQERIKTREFDSDLKITNRFRFLNTKLNFH
jgi:hypothetical protein